MIELNTGTLNCKGNVTVSNAGAHITGGTGTVALNGTAAQTLTGGSNVAGGLLPNITINKSAGTLTLSGTITSGGNWVYQAGTVITAVGSTVAFTHPTTTITRTIQCVSGANTMSFNNLSIRSSGPSTGSYDLASAATVTGNFTILTNGSFKGQTHTLTLNGNWTNDGTWTPGTGTVAVAGSGASSINKASGTETFTNLTLNKTAFVAVTLTKPTTVTGALTLTNGYLTTTATNLLTLNAGATVAGSSNTSFVNGPMRKIGNTAFTYPLGDVAVSGTPLHPLSITASAAVGDGYVAQYRGVAQVSGAAKAATLATLSTCEHWTLQRTSGTNTVTATLGWNGNCAVSTYAELVVAAWNGSQWTDLGAGVLSLALPQGTLRANLPMVFSGTTVVPLLLATKVVNQSYAGTSRQLESGFYSTNGHVLYFRYEEDYKDANGLLNYRIIRISDNSTVTLQNNVTTTNVPVVYGTNQYKMDLFTATNTPLAAGMYILEITNDKNEVYRLRFNKN